MNVFISSVGINIIVNLWWIERGLCLTLGTVPLILR